MDRPVSLAASFTPFRFVDATITWDERAIFVHDISDPSAPPWQMDVRRIEIASITSITLRQPWPAFDVRWEDDVLRRMFVHPRGLSRLVPASDAAREAFERFASLTEQMIAHVTTVSRDRVAIDRGWLDLEAVTWTRRDALPAEQSRSGAYRDAVVHDVLLARASIVRPLWTRLRIAARRARRAPTEPLPVELAISEREVWIVDDADVIWSVPRRALRAVYDDPDRIALVIGRNAFLAMSIADSAIRTALLEAGRRAVAQNDALDGV